MSYLLKITISVIKRRVTNCEVLDEILKVYPKLTTEEITIIRKEVI